MSTSALAYGDLGLDLIRRGLDGLYVSRLRRLAGLHPASVQP